MKCWVVPCPLHAWQWPARWFSTSPSFLQKVPCGLPGGHGTVGLVEMDGHGEWVHLTPLLQGQQEHAGSARQLATQTSFSFPFLLKPLEAVLKNAYIFNSKHVTSFKICGLHESHMAAWEVCHVLQTRFIYCQIRRSHASVSPAVIWSARTCYLKIS